MKKIKIILLCSVFLIFILGGCTKRNNVVNDTDIVEATTNDGIQLNLQSPETPDIVLENYNGSFFSINIPSGWTIETTGEYENFGFRLYDPSKPERQIFYYGNMRPFLKSDEAKEAWKTYLAWGGYSDAQVYADAPVLLPATTEQFFYTFDEFALLASNYGINHNFPVFENLEIVESSPNNSAMASVALDDSIIRGLFTYNGLPCEGLFAASVVDSMTSYMYDADAGYYTVYLITGITAPADEFYQMEKILAESLSSFQFTESYIQQGVAQNIWETNAAIQVGQTLSQAYDSYNQAWSNRQVVNDALSQKRSDATLGYDRLYDTVTGEVYRAELGFYEEYDINRNEYQNPNLEPVMDNDYNSYGKEISAYIYK